MKKKFLLTFLILSLLVCVFAISASASVIYKTSDEKVLFTAEVKDGGRNFVSYEGSFPTTDENGNALTWYVVNTETVNTDTVHTVASFNTIDTTGEHASLPMAVSISTLTKQKSLA